MTPLTFQAVYEDGVLRPLEPILFEERQEVTVTISGLGRIGRNHPLLAPFGEWANAVGDEVSIDEVRHALATIRGSLSEVVIFSI